MHTAIPLPVPCKRAPWNKGRLIGQKRPLKPKDVWAIRVRLQLQGRRRDLALFNLAIDSKFRGCDLVRLQVDDVCAGGSVRDRGTVIQKKTGRPVQFEITEQTRASIQDWLSKVKLRNGRYLFPSRLRAQLHLYPAVRSHRPCLGRECGARHFGLRHTFNAPDKGGADLQKDR
jgi:integrase